MPRPLPEGIYEALISLGLRDALAARPELRATLAAPEAADAADVLARYLSVEVARALDSLPKGDGAGGAADRLRRQAEIANEVLALLRARTSAAVIDERVLRASR